MTFALISDKFQHCSYNQKYLLNTMAPKRQQHIVQVRLVPDGHHWDIPVAGQLTTQTITVAIQNHPDRELQQRLRTNANRRVTVLYGTPTQQHLQDTEVANQQQGTARIQQNCILYTIDQRNVNQPPPDDGDGGNGGDGDGGDGDGDGRGGV